MRNIIEGLKNLWYFRKVIWQFRTWSDHSVLEVLTKSLQRVEDGMLSQKIVKIRPHELKFIRRTLIALNRCISGIDEKTDVDLTMWKNGPLNGWCKCSDNYRVTFKYKKGNKFNYTESIRIDENYTGPFEDIIGEKTDKAHWHLCQHNQWKSHELHGRPRKYAFELMAKYLNQWGW